MDIGLEFLKITFMQEPDLPKEDRLTIACFFDIQYRGAVFD